MEDEMRLPQWLDNLIFIELKANYCPSNCDMAVIDWDRNDVLNYLGTYFPRSYAEAVGIFGDYFKEPEAVWTKKKELSIFDFGCGTGGEIIGLLTVISKCLPNIKTVHVYAFDGNLSALRLLESVTTKSQERLSAKIDLQILPFVIEDFYDFTLFDEILTGKFDIIMSFKAICEFVAKDRFEKSNPYTHIAKCLLPKLNDNGIMVLEDVTTYNNVSKEWLPIMMDEGLEKADCRITRRNEGYNHRFRISHSQRNDDCSKVSWRIIKK